MTCKVAILGCGPSGLLVAHAAAMSGWDFRIYSRKQKSRLGGAQYLHEAIPGMTPDKPEAIVNYLLEGTPEQYRTKVYGETYDGPTSPEEMMSHTQYAWDIRKCYDKLWKAYSDDITNSDIQATWGLDPKRWFGWADLVVSTVPRTVWDRNPDNFAYSKVWVCSDMPPDDYVVPFGPPDNTVICDGTDEVGWYRIASIFGVRSIEYPGGLSKPPIEGMVQIRKPLDHKSTAAPGIIHLGRYGEWRKGVLTTDAFNRAREIFSK